MPLKLLVISLLSTSIFAWSQESRDLQGVILNDSITGIELNVVNTTLRVGTVTTQSGTFIIPVRPNDTINISSVAFENRQIVVTPVIYNRGKFSLYVVPKINQLDEVLVSNIDLTGDLSKDIATVPLAVFIDPKDLGIPANARPTMTVEERRFYGATGGAGPLGSLINAISGRTKMLKRHLEISRFRAMVEHNKAKFSDSTYIKSLRIPENRIEDFVYYVFEDEQAVKLANDGNTLGILEYMLKKSSLYLKLKAAESDLPIKETPYE